MEITYMSTSVSTTPVYCGLLCTFKSFEATKWSKTVPAAIRADLKFFYLRIRDVDGEYSYVIVWNVLSSTFPSL